VGSVQSIGPKYVWGAHIPKFLGTLTPSNIMLPWTRPTNFQSTRAFSFTI